MSGFAAETDAGLIVLDVERDRYLLARTTRSQVAAEPALKGLRFDPAAEGWRALGSLGPDGEWQAAAAVRGILALRRISRLLDHRPFEALIASVAAAPVRPRQRRLPAGRLLASFEAARPLFPRGRICRLDAPALCLLLRWSGYPARLFFGARLEPFGAHCWAELDGLVVNEAVESVTPFRPILVI